ncbi:MAG: dihydroorotase family protein [Crenarchaeota archaeon]|nr:dihydroorotase family protein [Thermoproteota archaeon]MCR8454917.1 dihydroorotase family protein [Thermoproteota archaeon]MCR8500708.1 dihydroorotase family protein [Thermoproteota archaeon]
MLVLRGLAFIGGKWQRANIAISDSGYIVRIWRSSYVNRQILSKVDAIYNASEYLIIPGLVDVHVHFREPGEEYKEDFATGSKAALASGITTVGDMPNNRPPIDSLENFKKKLQIVSKNAYTDFFLYVMLTSPSELSNIYKKYGSVPVKVYLYHRNSIENLFKWSLPRELLYVFHAEHPEYVTDHNKAKDAHELDSIRPIQAELKGLDVAIKFAMENKCRVHITHVTSYAVVKEIAEARKKGIRITCDVTPHHLVFFLERINPRSPLYKVLPPIRNRDAHISLIKAVARGLVDAIASDHAPHSHKEKECDFSEAPPGIAGIQYLLPLLYSISKVTNIDFELLVRMASENPARIFGIRKKGRIKVGNLADLVVFDPKCKEVIDPDKSLSKATQHPYNGMLVRGKVIATFLRGRLVYENEYITSKSGTYVWECN